jgi:hypothetical protein
LGRPEAAPQPPFRHGQQLGKPLLCIDAERSDIAAAISATGEFIATHGIVMLNVAGPRGSQELRGQGYADGLVRGVASALEKKLCASGAIL